MLLVSPQSGSEERFDDITCCLLQHPSSHLIGVYDASVSATPFIVHSTPESTLAEWTHPCDEVDVLALGSALAAGLASLHAEGLAHGHLHPGAVTIDRAGQPLLSPWPLALPPAGWEGRPGELAADPEDAAGASPAEDVRRLGALLLSVLAGPPLFSAEQQANLQEELRVRAPLAVHIVGRAMMPGDDGGYASAADVQGECAAAARRRTARRRGRTRRLGFRGTFRSSPATEGAARGGHTRAGRCHRRGRGCGLGRRSLTGALSPGSVPGLHDAVAHARAARDARVQRPVGPAPATAVAASRRDPRPTSPSA